MFPIFKQESTLLQDIQYSFIFSQRDILLHPHLKPYNKFPIFYCEAFQNPVKVYRLAKQLQVKLGISYSSMGTLHHLVEWAQPYCTIVSKQHFPQPHLFSNDDEAGVDSTVQ